MQPTDEAPVQQIVETSEGDEPKAVSAELSTVKRNPATTEQHSGEHSGASETLLGRGNHATDEHNSAEDEEKDIFPAFTHTDKSVSSDSLDRVSLCSGGSLLSEDGPFAGKVSLRMCRCIPFCDVNSKVK